MLNSENLPQNGQLTPMRGYYSTFGYCGFVDGKYRLFATEKDYRDYMMQR